MSANLTWTLLFAFAVVCRPSVSQAHFPWLAEDDAGRVVLFFSESPHERVYRIPEVLRDAKATLHAAHGAPQSLDLAPITNGAFCGLRSAGAPARKGVVVAPIEYGNYNGMLLTYYAQACLGVDPQGWTGTPTNRLSILPQVDSTKVEIAVTWDDRPLAGADVTIQRPNSEQEKLQTNAAGIVEFPRPAPGLIGALVARTDTSAKGTANGAEYRSAVDYATLTFAIADAETTSSDESSDDDALAATDDRPIPPLPEPVASFGAALCDGQLYVYGGHVGKEHAHSRKNLSQRFISLDLSGDTDLVWQQLTMETPLQGLPLVAYRGRLYRVGGLSMRNEPGEQEDLHSVDEFARFDPQQNEWTPLQPLPEARSSHDAAVIGDWLYVVGGWRLAGSSPGQWLGTAWRFDLRDPDSEWVPVAAPPLRRRALAIAAWGDRLAAIGGMDDSGVLSRRVDLFDVHSGQWSTASELPDDDMAGFGVSAWSQGGVLYASSADGRLLQLESPKSSWRTTGQLRTGRFFHRLVPDDRGRLLAVAGASKEAGHLATVERLATGPQAVRD